MRPGVCILAAPGPSLPSFGLDEHGTPHPIIAITSAFSAVRDAAHVYASDRRWWDACGDEVARVHPQASRWMAPDCPGMARDVWRASQSNPPPAGVVVLDANVTAAGISRTPGLIHTGRNSGFAAINLAVLLGFTTLLLVGYDMREVDGKPHFFGRYKDVRLDRESPYHEWAPLFRTIKCDGFEVINCTHGSAIDAFPFGVLGDYL